MFPGGAVIEAPELVAHSVPSPQRGKSRSANARVGGQREQWAHDIGRKDAVSTDQPDRVLAEPAVEHALAAQSPAVRHRAVAGQLVGCQQVVH
jgi:hypothetical protein